MHLAAKIPFKTLIEGLEQEVTLGYIAKKQSGGLTLYNYNQRCTFQKHWNEYTLVARGLVVNATGIVAYPFPKFFNYGEVTADELPSFQNVKITEKFDGSLGIVFHDGTSWRVITRGSFDSSQAQLATSYVMAMTTLIPGITYLVEIISPDNKIVIAYPEEKLVLLGAYDNKGMEITDLRRLGTGWEITPQFEFASGIELMQFCRSLSGDKEGFVVRFEDGLRIKFKGDKYCELHRHLSGCTPQRIWEALRKCENLKESLPEESYADYDKIADEFLRKYEYEVGWLRVLNEQYIDFNNKAIAFMEISEEIKQLIFTARRKQFADEIHTASKTRSTLFERFRPK